MYTTKDRQNILDGEIIRVKEQRFKTIASFALFWRCSTISPIHAINKIGKILDGSLRFKVNSSVSQ